MVHRSWEVNRGFACMVGRELNSTSLNPSHGHGALTLSTGRRLFYLRYVDTK